MSDPQRLRPSPFEALWILVGVVLTIQYAWLIDDAYVYFRYVDNAVHLGNGLVYNAGEYVEGYSSPLWILLLLGLRQLGAGYWVLVQLVGALTFVGFAVCLIAVERWSTPPDVASTPAVNLPLCFFSVAYGPLCYFTSGLESPLVQLAAAFFALFTLRPGSKMLQVAVGIAPILRHELAVPVMIAAAYALLRTRRVPWTLLGVGLVGTLGWEIFRIAYYADLFPNTFYLKNDVHWRQGWIYAWDTLSTYRFVPLLLPAAFVGLVAWRRPVSGDLATAWNLTPRLAMLLLALPVFLYVVRIGGDPRHYRYLAFPMVLLLVASSGVEKLFLPRLRSRIALTNAGLGALAFVLGVTAVPPQLDGHPLLGRPTHRLVRKISDAEAHRAHASIDLRPWTTGAKLDQRASYRGYLTERGSGAPRGLTIGWWCVTLYEQFDARAIHSLGLTEPILARTEMSADRPAHKLGLQPLGDDLFALLRRASRPPQQGFYRAAVRAGLAPVWIADNLATIEVIEAKAYNHHRWRDNLELAFTFPPPIRVGGASDR